jgi:hypothetical protein
MHKTKRTNKYFKKHNKRKRTIKNKICKKGMTDEATKFYKLIKTITKTNVKTEKH